MEKRNCGLVIVKMRAVIPETKKDLHKDLEWNFEDSQYKAPEETLQWERTMQTLIKHIPKPVEDWEFKVLEIFTTRSREEIEKMIRS